MWLDWYSEVTAGMDYEEQLVPCWCGWRKKEETGSYSPQDRWMPVLRRCSSSTAPSLIKSTHTERRIDRERGEGMGEVWHVRFLSGGVRTFPSHDLREQCQICMVPDCQVTQPIVLYMCHMCFIRVGVHAHTHAHHMTCVWVWDAVIGLNLRHPHRCVHHHSRMLSSTWAAHERCKQLCGDLIANVNCELRQS